MQKGKNFHSVCDKSTIRGMGEVLNIAKFSGWEEALYYYKKMQIQIEARMMEDIRSVDWRYLLPLSKETIALVVGCGLGTVAIALSETCGKVYVVDSSWEKIAFLNIRKRQQRIENLYPIHVNNGLNFPFRDQLFDLISIKEYPWNESKSLPLLRVIQYIYSLLKNRGILHLSLGNRLWPRHLFRKREGEKTAYFHTIFGYRWMLKTKGFSEIQFYAPLPYHNGIPLFYIPLESSQAINFFLRNIFPLFDMVSPEVKRLYGLEYRIAKIGICLMKIFKLEGLLKWFVPGYCIIAKRG